MSHLSPTRLALRRLKKNRIAMVSLIALFILYIAAIFAPSIAPYHFDSEKREHSFAPPSRIHFDGVKPYVYDYEFKFDELKRRIYSEDVSKKYYLEFFKNWKIFSVEKEGRFYLLGADSRGRDIFSRIIYGSRVSLSIGLIGIFITFIFGLFIGGISGYFGGKTDFIIMRLTEMIMMIPGFYLVLSLRAAFPPTLSSVEVYLLITFIFSFLGWAGLARIIRGMVISLKEREYVVAAKCLGSSPVFIILKHLLPQTISYTLVAMTLSIPSYIIGESALSFLGLGIHDPHTSWGNMLSEALAINEIKFHPWILMPGILIIITVLCFNLLGDGLRDAFDVKLKEQ